MLKSLTKCELVSKVRSSLNLRVMCNHSAGEFVEKHTTNFGKVTPIGPMR